MKDLVSCSQTVDMVWRQNMEREGYRRWKDVWLHACMVHAAWSHCSYSCQAGGCVGCTCLVTA